MNQKTYVPVEVARDRKGRMIYTPIIPTEKPKINFGAEIRTLSETDNDEQKSTSNEIPKKRENGTRPQRKNKIRRANN